MSRHIKVDVTFQAEYRVILSRLVDTFISRGSVKNFVALVKNGSFLVRITDMTILIEKRNFFCGNRECGFFLWKENRYLSGMKKMIDKKMAAELLKDGRTYVPDLYSQKKGRTFAAYLMLEAADGKAAFRLEFPKKKK